VTKCAKFETTDHEATFPVGRLQPRACTRASFSGN
jgi:hypothetical protein